MRKLSPLLLTSLLSFQMGIAQVDYRIYQSPVRDQVDRGTCTAFAVLAAMETFSGFPSDLSEQYVYALTKMKYYKNMPDYDEGATLQYYIDILQRNGTLREDQDPYNPNAPIWAENGSSFEKMKKDLKGSVLDYLKNSPGFSYKLAPDMYDYRRGEQAKDVAYIKQMLDKGIKAIPVAYSLSGAYWFNHEASDQNPIDLDFLYFKENSTQYDFRKAKLEYGQDLFQKIKDGSMEAFYTNDAYECSEGHAVAIVGYNDKGFLIKNSWGVDKWGDKGYGWISFDYHRLFANETFVMMDGKFAVNRDYNINDDVWKKEDYWIKTLPNEYHNSLLKMHSKGIEVSVVYHGETQMPDFAEIKYDAFDRNGNLLGTFYANTQGIFDGRRNGYATQILGKDTDQFPSCYKLVADFKTKNGKTFTNTYYNLSATNQEYRAR